jgi:hypothetical protein
VLALGTCVCWGQETTAHAIPCDGRALQQCCVSWRGILGGGTRIDVLLWSVITQRAGLANGAAVLRVRRTGGRCAVGGGSCAAKLSKRGCCDAGGQRQTGQHRGGGEAALRALRAAPRAGGASTPRWRTGLLTGEAEQHAGLRRGMVRCAADGAAVMW